MPGIYEGMVERGLRVFRAVHDRHQPGSAKPGNPFNEPEAGQHYSRAMSAYAVFLALCGYHYDGPAGAISLSPRLGAVDFRATFTASSGWGSFSQEQSSKAMTASLALHFGQLELKSLGLTPQETSTPETVLATLDGQPVSAELQFQPGLARILFDPAVTITAGQSLTVKIE